jgi:hypothetical protein
MESRRRRSRRLGAATIRPRLRRAAHEGHTGGCATAATHRDPLPMPTRCRTVSGWPDDVVVTVGMTCATPGGRRAIRGGCRTNPSKRPIVVLTAQRLTWGTMALEEPGRETYLWRDVSRPGSSVRPLGPRGAIWQL